MKVEKLNFLPSLSSLIRLPSPADGRPVDYIEEEEDDWEDDEEADVNGRIIVLLPLTASQSPQLHLH